MDFALLRPTRAWVRPGIVVGALVAGWITAEIALAAAGGGHGWSSASISAIAIALMPLTAVAFLFREADWAMWLTLALAAAGILFDGILLVSTHFEGWRYFQKAVGAGPIRTVFWAGLWFGWQAVAWMLFLPAWKRWKYGA